MNIWAARLGREAAKRKDLESEIRLLDAEIEKLEGLLQEVSILLFIIVHGIILIPKEIPGCLLKDLGELGSRCRL